MAKSLIITEKPSVAQEFARILGVSGRNDGYIENSDYVITWCVGHLVEMVYPEVYDEKYKKWKLEDLPFLPKEYKYDVIPAVSKQYDVVHKMLHREDIDTVYWAGDAGKGFAVVASQIQKLAEQSNTSSGTIEEITGELISDSGIAVETMLRVKEIVDTQSRNMEETEHIVNEVMGGIRTSLGSIDSIEKGAVRLETSRNEIVQTVEDLSRIAAENAENTQKTCEQTMQVADTFERIEGNAVKLKEIADELSQTIRHFHL